MIYRRILILAMTGTSRKPETADDRSQPENENDKQEDRDYEGEDASDHLGEVNTNLEFVQTNLAPPAVGAVEIDDQNGGNLTGSPTP